MLAACRRAVRQPMLRAAARPFSSTGSHSDFGRKTKIETSEADSVRDFIKSTVETNPVTLFMKGTPEYPQCGFSQQVRRPPRGSDCIVVGCPLASIAVGSKKKKKNVGQLPVGVRGLWRHVVTVPSK
jgi:hypothetical protein